MKCTRAGTVAALFLAGWANAEEPRKTQDREQTREEVFEALAVHAGMPVQSPVMPNRDTIDPTTTNRATEGRGSSGSPGGVGTGGSQGGGSQGTGSSGAGSGGSGGSGGGGN